MLPKLRKGDAGAAHPWPRAGCSMQGTARVAPLGTGVSQGSTGQVPKCWSRRRCHQHSASPNHHCH